MAFGHTAEDGSNRSSISDRSPYRALGPSDRRSTTAEDLDGAEDLMLLDDDGADMADLLGYAARGLLGLTDQRPGSALADRCPGRLAELTTWTTPCNKLR